MIKKWLLIVRIIINRFNCINNKYLNKKNKGLKIIKLFDEKKEISQNIKKSKEFQNFLGFEI